MTRHRCGIRQRCRPSPTLVPVCRDEAAGTQPTGRGHAFLVVHGCRSCRLLCAVLLAGMPMRGPGGVSLTEPKLFAILGRIRGGACCHSSGTDVEKPCRHIAPVAQGVTMR